MNYKNSLKKSLQSIILILKLIIPIYILADILFYYNLLSYISFLVEPMTKLLGLPPEASLSIISGMFLNVYAAVAFAAPLDLSLHQWSILAVFIGVCHSLVVESIIMKKIGLSNFYSYSLRIIAGFIIGYITALMPSSLFSATLLTTTFERVEYDSIFSLLENSFINAFILSLKIIALITIIIFIMDYIKSLPFIKKSSNNVSKVFSLLVGLFLGITYGAGTLIKEVEDGNINKKDIFFVGTFLMICHSIIEDTLLFVIFGADFMMVIIIRTISALIISYLLLYFYSLSLDKKKNQTSDDNDSAVPKNMKI